MLCKRQEGSLALILCIGLAFVGALGGLYFAFNGAGSASSGQHDPLATYESLRDQVDQAMGKLENISYSLERNPNPFSCLYSSSGACQGEGGLFLFYDKSESGGQPLSQLMRDSGLNADGLGCKGFPSAACPLRVEAQWSPVCERSRCENTHNVKVKIKVVYYDPAGRPLEWAREEVYSPRIQLSEAVECERSGMVWTTRECLSPDQADARMLASRSGAKLDPYEADRLRNEEVRAPVAPEYYCPDQINLQGLTYTVEYLGPAPNDDRLPASSSAVRAQVRVPAMNGCPAEDTFVFQCSPKIPANFEGEGQWVQVEAIMAPNCDEIGEPLGDSYRM